MNMFFKLMATGAIGQNGLGAVKHVNKDLLKDSAFVTAQFHSMEEAFVMEMMEKPNHVIWENVQV